MKVAVLIPCYNEAITIAKVVKDFQRELPDAEIWVYDNNSSDGTAEIAARAGANVGYETLQGKGSVIRTMFRDVEADHYIIIDGDDTYPVSSAKEMLNAAIAGKTDLLNGDRLSEGSYFKENTRKSHNMGNIVICKTINRIFNSNIHDVTTGYRVFSRRFVKSFPNLKNGFEIETEITIFALANNFRIKEFPITFVDRPEGSVSKLNTVSDGIKVMKTIAHMYRHYRPLGFFSVFALISFVAGLFVGIFPVIEYFQTGFVAKLPSAVLASGLVIIAVLLIMLGLILDTIAYNHREQTEQFLKMHR